MLSENEIQDLVRDHGERVAVGRTIKEIIQSGDIPRLNDATVLEGKVSDSVVSDSLKTKDGVPIRLMFRSNRISTHDKNRGYIPFKDQVLAVNHNHMLGIAKEYIGTSQFAVPGVEPTSTVIASENLELLGLEMVLRAYMAQSSTSTSLYQAWKSANEGGAHEFEYSGRIFTTLELSPNCKLESVIDTPSTKAKEDKTVDSKYLVDNGVCTDEQYAEILASSLNAFNAVSDYVQQRGLVLVDTKTEHGVNSNGEIVSADELYTMDSSRFWKMDGNGNLDLENGKPRSFSKEFARDMVKGPDQTFTAEQAKQIAVRYIQGIQHITQSSFEPDIRERDERIIASTNTILDYLCK